MIIDSAIQQIDNTGMISRSPKPTMYISIFGVWLCCLLWFHPRLWSLVSLAENYGAYLTLVLFVIFIEFAWLYGVYNVMVLVFAFIYKYSSAKPEIPLSQSVLAHYPRVAILYTTYNDFIERSVLSCVHHDY